MGLPETNNIQFDIYYNIHYVIYYNNIHYDTLYYNTNYDMYYNTHYDTLYYKLQSIFVIQLQKV